MLERMSGASVEGWRLRRVPRRPHGRAPRAVVAGETPLALDVACRLSAAGASQVAQGLEGASTADALIICSDEPALVREAALWAARACPWTAIILAARRGLALSAEAARASGLPPWLILSPGGIPHAAAETARLARRLDVCASQVDVPVIGGDAPGATRVLRRYVTVAGVPLEDLEAPGPAPWRREPASPVTEAALGAAAILLALCVLGIAEGSSRAAPGWRNRSGCREPS